jgi:RNA polymerase sigma factor (sigma-70 family)
MLQNPFSAVGSHMGRGDINLDGMSSDRELLQRVSEREDDVAFAVLVRRYSRLVMGVCQRVLRNVHDAEDAFQATFVVLWCKAGTIAKPELLGNWLYGVAFRTSQKLRTTEARRRVREENAPAGGSVNGQSENGWHEERAVLDEELLRLPEKYRMPLMLCYLDGKTHAEVAQQLGWPIGSVSARLSRGLQLMRERLSRRNPAFGLALVPMLLAEQTKAAWLPDWVLDAIFKILMEPQALSPVKILANSTMQSMTPPPSLWRKALVPALALILIGGLIYNGVVIGAMISGHRPPRQFPRTQSTDPAPVPAQAPPASGPCHVEPPPK